MPKDSPNEPILEKLRQELISVYAKKKGHPPVGKLTVRDEFSDNNSDLSSTTDQDSHPTPQTL